MDYILKYLQIIQDLDDLVLSQQIIDINHVSKLELENSDFSYDYLYNSNK